MALWGSNHRDSVTVIFPLSSSAAARDIKNTYIPTMYTAKLEERTGSETGETGVIFGDCYSM